MKYFDLVLLLLFTAFDGRFLALALTCETCDTANNNSLNLAANPCDGVCDFGPNLLDLCNICVG